MDVRFNTEYWLDYYTAYIEQLYSSTSDPNAWFERLGIANEKNVVATPQAASMESIRESREAWKSVKRDLRAFGLTLSGMMEYEPLEAVYCADPSTLPIEQQENARAKRGIMEWVKKPWFTAKHQLELIPVRFEGRKAITAVCFFAWWLNQIKGRVDPRQATRDMLSRQGITAENFDQHADRLMIKNPWL